jgi:hypothetical protein
MISVHYSLVLKLAVNTGYIRKDIMSDEPLARNTNGTFAIGNASGARRGKHIDKVALGILKANSGAITEKAIALALAGDTSMITLCLNKLLPQSSLIQQQLQEQIEALEEANRAVH